jgi:hypothetical protein
VDIYWENIRSGKVRLGSRVSSGIIITVTCDVIL